MTKRPRFIAASPLLRGAYDLAYSAHHGPAREGETEIDHPVAVASLLHERGFDEQIVAAGLLHDVVEDTSLELEPVVERFGPEVGHLVEQMTEDDGIDDYARRKAEHRSRIASDRRVAAIYAADKLANIRDLEPGTGEVPREKLDHYFRTLEVLSDEHPDLPFLSELRDELGAFAGSASA